MHCRVGLYVLDTALLQWIGEYAVRAYTTADSAVSYLYHARIANRRLLCDARLQPKVAKTQYDQCELSVV